MTNRTLIIAEAGVNHNGDEHLAIRLVEEASKAGADFVKFQTFSAKRLATKAAPTAAYQAINAGHHESQIELLNKLELSQRMHHTLLNHCRKHNIRFLSTGFDIPSLDFLSSLDPELFKVPSGEITNLPYLRHVASFGKPIILSSGMSTLGEIESALEALEHAGTSRTQITVLHCNTEYPTPFEDVHLRAMCSLRDAFGVSVGYSDHTLGTEVPVAAVALGAKVIEKHLTLDQNLEGPDHRASLTPELFAQMVKAIRNIESALGTGIKRPSPSELKNRDVARKSVVAAAPIKSGEPFTPQNLSTKRPGGGLSPMLWDEIIGKRARKDFEPDEMIEL